MWREIILCCFVLANIVESKIIINDPKPEDSSERLRRDAVSFIAYFIKKNHFYFERKFIETIVDRGN